MEQRLITIDEIQVGDEVIISSHSSLKYLKILRLPVKKDSSTFKCSIKRMQRTSGHWNWGINSFEQDVTQHNHVFYQNFYDRDIFLVKRENNN
jgi:hypothetical protein